MTSTLSLHDSLVIIKNVPSLEHREFDLLLWVDRVAKELGEHGVGGRAKTLHH